LSNLPAGSIYRANQEVQFARGNNIPIALGSWSITDLASGFDQLTFSIGLSNFSSPLENIGLHWAMTCGNDVIEGSAFVPEPHSAALLGFGALGAALRRRRRSPQ
jgi:hypothetical protein